MGTGYNLFVDSIDQLVADKTAAQLVAE